MTDTAVTYRDATPADGPALDAMARQIWLETFHASASPEDIALFVAGAYGPQGTLIRHLGDPANHHFRLACAGEEIVGYLKLSTLSLEAPEIMTGAAQLSQLYVASRWHGSGIAQALMGWAIDTGRQRGATALVLTVWEDNERAKRFYDRYGFVHIADYAYQTGNQVDRDLIMQLVL